MEQTIYDYSAKAIDGKEVRLSDFKDKILLVVNVASKCGFTPQYKALEELFKRHSAQGVTVLGFPCDQFGHQEAGNEEEIRSFCEKNYGVTFPMFSKIEVNGPASHPLYEFLKTSARGILGTKKIKWNFTKFLIGRDGRVIRRYGPTVKPEAISKDIATLLHDEGK